MDVQLKSDYLCKQGGIEVTDSYNNRIKIRILGSFRILLRAWVGKTKGAFQTQSTMLMGSMSVNQKQ